MIAGKNFHGGTEPTPTPKSFSGSFENFGIGKQRSLRRFKKNDTVKFKSKKKLKTGKVTKVGSRGVDVICNSLYYYCYCLDLRTGIFEKSNETKNYR